MSNQDRDLNRLVLAQLLDDETVQRIAQRIPNADVDTIREGILDHTQLIMSASVTHLLPIIVEKSIKESLQSF